MRLLDLVRLVEVRLEVAAVRVHLWHSQGAAAGDGESDVVGPARFSAVLQDEGDRRGRLIAGARARGDDTTHVRGRRIRRRRLRAHDGGERLLVDVEVVAAGPVDLEVVGLEDVAVDGES